jgi:hypothetical protein
VLADAPMVPLIKPISERETYANTFS